MSLYTELGTKQNCSFTYVFFSPRMGYAWTTSSSANLLSAAVCVCYSRCCWHVNGSNWHSVKHSQMLIQMKRCVGFSYKIAHIRQMLSKFFFIVMVNRCGVQFRSADSVLNWSSVDFLFCTLFGVRCLLRRERQRVFITWPNFQLSCILNVTYFCLLLR